MRATLVGVLLLFGTPARADIESECWGGDLDLSMNLDCEEKSCVKDWDRHIAERFERDELFPPCDCEICNCDQGDEDGEEEE